MPTLRASLGLLTAALVVAPLALGCGAPDGGPIAGEEGDLTAFACTANGVEQGSPRAYFGPFDAVDREALCVLDRAEREVLVAQYNIRSQAFLDKLAALAARGVRVRAAVDMESSREAHNGGDDFLEAHGVEVVRTKPAGADAVMHLKVAVIDGEVAMAGSFNWNATASHANDENMVVLRDAEPVARYRDQILEILGDRARTVEAGTMPGGMRLNFSPEERLDTLLVEQIDGALTSIDVAMFTFTSAPVTAALVRALDRGVRVRLVTERKQSEKSSADDDVAEAGALVVEAANRIGSLSAMHHKYAVVDASRVITGATNWTHMGTRANEEDLLVLENATLAADYARNFADLLHVYTGLDQAEPHSDVAGVMLHAVHDATEPGDRVVVVGSDPALGAWDPFRGVEMATSDDLFPSWTGRLKLPAGTRLEYKFATLSASGAVRWEPGQSRALQIPATGRGTVVTGRFGDTSHNWTPAEEP